MSTSASESKKKSYVPRPRTQPLRRGKACTNCRHLKIKCDGARPVCGPCMRIPQDDDCEYTDTPSRTQELQESVERLQARIHELETGSMPSSSSGLNMPSYVAPYNPPYIDFTTRRSPGTGGSSPSFSNVGLSSGDSSNGDSDRILSEFQEPNYQMVLVLVDNFLPHALVAGFFLHTDRFRQAALLQLPFGDAARPAPALLCAVYLWGAHLSPSDAMTVYESTFMDQTLYHLGSGISSVTALAGRGKGVIETIQAQILLAFYFFRTCRFMEAEFHANGALSLALTCDLHKICSSRMASPSVLGVSSGSSQEIRLSVPNDSTEEWERINGFWAIFCLQRQLMISLNKPSNVLGTLESPASDIDTPWPLDMMGYENGPTIHPIQGESTMKAFFTHPSTTASPAQYGTAEGYTKATILFHRAVCQAERWRPDLTTEERNSFDMTTSAVDRVVSIFQTTLAPLGEVNSSSDVLRVSILTHALTLAAKMKLHQTYSSSNAQSKERTITAAQSILDLLPTMPEHGDLNPILGTLYFLACQVLVQQIHLVRQSYAAWNQIAGLSDEEGLLRTALTSAVVPYMILAESSPFMNYQLSKIQALLRTIQV